MSGHIRYYPNGSETASELTFDVVESEEVTLDNEVTDNPVEEGADVSDHVRQKPDVVRITATVSNTSTTGAQATYHPEMRPPKFVLKSKADNKRPGDDALELLKQLREAGDPVELYLGTKEHGRSYESMEITSLSFPRDAKTGDVLRFSASFKKVRIAESETVAAPKTAVPRSQGTTERGTQPAKTTSGADSDKAGSTYHHWFGESVSSVLNPGGG